MLRRLPKSDGIFETILVHDGRPVAAAEHLRRLRRSAELVYGALLPLPEQLERDVGAAAAAAPASDARLRVRFRPGESVSYEAVPAPESLIAVGEQPPLALRLLELTGGLGDHKWCDRRVLERDGDPRPPLLVDGGWVLEAGHANVAALEGGRIVTPPLDGRILPGVTRVAVLALAAQLGLQAVEEPLQLERLAAADAVFLMSSIRGVQAVSAWDDAASWGDSPHVTELARALRERWLEAG